MNTFDFTSDVESQRSHLTFIARSAWPAKYVPECGPSDLVQQALLRAFRGCHDFRGESERELRVWLRRILRNVIVNEIRRIRAKKRSPAGRSEIVLEEVPTSAASSFTELLRAEAGTFLNQALDRLPPGQAAVIRLKVFHGLTLVEIANQLGKSEAAIQKVWSRSISQLKKELRDYAGTTSRG